MCSIQNSDDDNNKRVENSPVNNGTANADGQNGYCFGIADSGYRFMLNGTTGKYADTTALDMVAHQIEILASDPVLGEKIQAADTVLLPEVEPVSEKRVGGFSTNFKFKPTLLNIFWKIDGDHDHRLSKQELNLAVLHGKFHDDEQRLAELLWTHFDYIRRKKLSTSTFFDQRGLSVEEIMTYPWSTFIPPDSLPEQDPNMSSSRLKTVKRS